MFKKEKSRENYLRVTKVLYPFSGLQHINPDVLENAARRGTKVHKICEGIASGIGEIGTDDETWGYVESFKKWFETDIKIIEIEKRFWDDQLCFTGQVDFIIRTEEGLAIVDIKTSSKPSKTWSAQGCAYAYLAKKSGYDIKKIFFLHLNKQGKEPKIYEYDVNDYFFFAIYTTYIHFYHKEQKMNNLTEKMQERLDKWRKNPKPIDLEKKERETPVSRRNGKNDYGDAMTLEDWNEEAKKSQTRK